MLPSFMRRPYQRKRFPTVTDHGTTVVDYKATPSVVTIYGSLQPADAVTDQVNRDGAEIAYVILAQPTSDVHHADQIALSDGAYYVNGEPQRWAVGILDHMVIRLSRWLG